MNKGDTGRQAPKGEEAGAEAEKEDRTAIDDRHDLDRSGGESRRTTRPMDGGALRLSLRRLLESSSSMLAPLVVC